jgi:MFS family permease
LVTGKRKLLVFVVLILAGESIFFLPFVLARIFRPTLLKVLDITNLELGTYFSIYGVVAMLSYFFGGALADRFPGRKLMSIALWATALGGGVMAVLPSSSSLGWLYGFWGMTTIFLFWAALIKSTRALGGSNFQGRAFGILEGGRGFTAAVLASLAMFIFASLTGDEAGSAYAAERITSFKWVIATTSIITAFSGLLVWFIVPNKLGAGQGQTLPSLREFKRLLKRKGLWLQAVTVVCAYVGYKITDDFSLYANEVLGFNEVNSAAVGTAALWMRPVFALLAGFVADRWSSSKVITYCFVLMFIGGCVTFLGVMEGVVWLVLLVLATTLIGVYGLRGVYFALMEEDRIPMGVTGAAVGVISLLGFTPDVFMSPLMGYLLDAFPGATGHRYVFFVLTCFSLLGMVVSIVFSKRGINENSA